MTTAQAFETLTRNARDPQSQEALKHLRGIFGRSSKIRAADQTVYLRLYGWAYLQLLKHWVETPDQTQAQRELHTVLSKPLEHWAAEIAIHSNMLDLEYYTLNFNRPPTDKWVAKDVQRNLTHQALEAVLAYTPEEKRPEPRTTPQEDQSSPL